MIINKYRFISCAKFLWMPPLGTEQEKMLPACMPSGKWFFFYRKHFVRFFAKAKKINKKLLHLRLYFCVKQVTTNHSTKWLSVVRFCMSTAIHSVWSIEVTKRRKKENKSGTFVTRERNICSLINIFELVKHTWSTQNTQLAFLSLNLLEKIKYKEKNINRKWECMGRMRLFFDPPKIIVSDFRFFFTAPSKVDHWNIQWRFWPHSFVSS